MAPREGVRVKFKHPQVELEWRDPSTHDELKRLLISLDVWCQGEGIEGVVLTDVFRTPSFYKEYRWSWHYVGCAADLRIWHWSPAQQAKAIQWLKEQASGSEWEVVVEDHGTGPHFHVAYRDFRRRREWESSRSTS
jgi:hypothetical protein